MNKLHGRIDRRAFLTAVGASAVWAAAPARAQPFPAKPIRIVVPAPAGSLPDAMARLYANEMKEELGQPFVIDNKPGAAGALAAGDVVKASADGYTLLLAVDTMLTVNPLIYNKLPYDPLRDLKPVALVAKTGGVIVANPKLGVKTLPEFVRLAQSKPGAINYASGGSGHATHLGMELLAQTAGIKMTHVPYKGTPQAVQDVIAGECSLMFVGYVEALGHVKTGRLMALASTGQAAKTVVPDVVELKDYYPDFSFETWFPLLAPAGTPDAVVQRLHAAVAKAGESAVVKQKLLEFGVITIGGAPAVVNTMLRADVSRYEPLVKTLGLKAD